jgi:tRNA A37 threonylcarbamoyladenosine modification protein TsaB
MKKFLGFNTLSKNLEAILFSDSEIIDSERDDSGLMQNEILSDFLKNFLKKNNLKYKNLDFLVFLNGPSSFMKIRNSISFGLGIQFALKNQIKLINFNLFEIYESIISREFDGLENFVIILKGFAESVFVFDSKLRFPEMIKISNLENHILEKNLLDFNFFFDSEEIFLATKDYINHSFFSEKSKIFSDFHEGNLIDEVFYILKNQDLKAENSEFFKIKPHYIFDPEFKKINQNIVDKFD